MKATSSDNPTPTKCLSGILGSLLCTGSPPTDTSDQFNIESSTTKINNQNSEKYSESEAGHAKQAAASSNPGVVARLMGLDSFPVNPLPPRQKTLGSYFRSRSVNSIDFLSQFDPVKQAFHRRQHRRARTSISYREVPSLFVLDDKFSVVFPIEELDESAECKEERLFVTRNTSVIYQKGKMEKRVTGESKNGENCEERTVKKKRPGKKMELEEGRRSVCAKFQSGVATQKKDFNGRTSVNLKERRGVINKPEQLDCKVRRPIGKRVKKKKVHGVEKIHPEPNGKGEVSQEVRSDKHSSSLNRTNSSCPLTDNGKIRAVTKKKLRNECTNMLEEILRLTQESVDEINSDWTYGQNLKFEDFEDICVQFGRQILEVLLLQIFDELVLPYDTRK